MPSWYVLARPLHGCLSFGATFPSSLRCVQALRDTRKMRERFEGYLDRKAAELARRLGSSIVVRSYNLGVAAPYITEASVVESVIEPPNKLVCIPALCPCWPQW